MEEAPEVRCPRCESATSIYLSRLRFWSLDPFMLLFGKRPFRCLDCKTRFYAKPV
jgi:hypothetical protein